MTRCDRVSILINEKPRKLEDTNFRGFMIKFSLVFVVLNIEIKTASHWRCVFFWNLIPVHIADFF